MNQWFTIRYTVRGGYMKCVQAGRSWYDALMAAQNVLDNIKILSWSMFEYHSPEILYESSFWEDIDGGEYFFVQLGSHLMGEPGTPLMDKTIQWQLRGNADEYGLLPSVKTWLHTNMQDDGYYLTVVAIGASRHLYIKFKSHRDALLFKVFWL